MQVKNTYGFLFFALLSLWGGAQEVEYTGNPDTSYFTARSLAFDGQREIARDTLNRVLSKYPDYTDVRSLLASTYSWDGKYDDAREQFNHIISSERKNKEVWIAAIKNEIYAEDYYIALGLSNKALLYLKDDADVVMLKSRALKNLKEKETAPVDTTVTLAKESFESKIPKNNLTFANSIDVFDIVYDPMVYSSISYSRKTKVGSIIPRINYANRFETHGLQYELDFYPKFSKTFYAYLNYGYSDAPIFPDHRVGAELYANLPKAFEFSIGVRYLDFSTTKATVYTGSIGLYRGNYYFSLRPYVTPQNTGDISFSGGLLARKYLRDGENYFGVNMGMGYAPELKQFRAGDELLAETLLFIESERLAFEYQFTGKKNPNSYNVNLGVVRQELVFDSGNFVWSVSAGLTYQVKF